jgi:putative membrane protein
VIRRFGASIAFLAGLGLAAVLAAKAGFGAVGHAFTAVGWSGLLAVCLLQMLSVAVCAGAWRAVAEGSSYLACLLSRWIRDGASNLWGFIPAIGEGISARALAVFGGASAGGAAATTIVDVGVEALSQAVYTLLAFAFLFPHLGVGQAPKWLLIVALSLLPVLLMFVVSRNARALKLGQRIASRLAALLGVRGGRFNLSATVRDIYRQRRRIALSFTLHLLAWTTGAAQLWLAARAIGAPISFAGGLALHGLVCAARSALFLVPLAAGVQEGGFLLVGAVLGISPPAAIALSLVLRARDVLVGAPAIVLWYAAEGRRRWLKGRDGDGSGGAPGSSGRGSGGPSRRYEPVDLEAAAAAQGETATPHHEASEWISRSQVYCAGELKAHDVGFTTSPMRTATLSNVTLVDTLYPLIGERFVYHGMHHNADLLLGKFFNPDHTPAELFLKRTRRAGEAPLRRGPHFLVGGDSNNFWHFLYNFVLRLSLVAESPDRELREDARLVINADLPQSFRPVFEALGFDPARLEAASRQSPERFETLTVAELPCFNQGGGRKLFATPQALDFVRERLPGGGKQGRRIYVSRRDARWRRVLNEDELAPVLERRGVETIELSKLSASEIIAAMGQAELVIGPSGANLGALMFCRPGAKVIELSYPPFVGKYYFQGSSSMGGLDHFKLAGTPERTERDYTTWDFTVPPAELDELLTLAGF